MQTLIDRINIELEYNEGKLSSKFIEAELNSPSTKVEHQQVGDSCRVCVITLPAGHKLVGYALVLDPSNDVATIGQEVAYNNAKEKIWEVYGSVAKALMEGMK